MSRYLVGGDEVGVAREGIGTCVALRWTLGAKRWSCYRSRTPLVGYIGEEG